MRFSMLRSHSNADGSIAVAVAHQALDNFEYFHGVFLQGFGEEEEGRRQWRLVNVQIRTIVQDKHSAERDFEQTFCHIINCSTGTRRLNIKPVRCVEKYCFAKSD